MATSLHPFAGCVSTPAQTTACSYPSPLERQRVPLEGKMRPANKRLQRWQHFFSAEDGSPPYNVPCRQPTCTQVGGAGRGLHPTVALCRDEERSRLGRFRSQEDPPQSPRKRREADAGETPALPGEADAGGRPVLPGKPMRVECSRSFGVGRQTPAEWLQESAPIMQGSNGIAKVLQKPYSVRQLCAA